MRMNGGERMEKTYSGASSDFSKFITELRSGGPLSLARRVVRSLAFRTVLGPQDRKFDRLLANDTAEKASPAELAVSGPNAQYGLEYAATSGALLHMMLRDIKVDFRDYTFIDIGSGKGRVLCLAGLYPFKKVIGIEFSERLHQDALDNVHAFQRAASPRCQDIEPICQDAADLTLPDTPVIIYLYNPFLRPVLLKFIERLKQQYEVRGKKIYLIYHNPMYRSDVEGLGIFRPVKREVMHRIAHSIASPHSLILYET
jgi:hypothetical protein